MTPTLRRLAVLGAGIGLFLAPRAPSAASREAELVHNAASVLRQALSAPANAIPVSLARDARAFAVFPSSSADGTLYYGRGVAGARSVEPGKWLAPGIVTFKAELGAPPPAKKTDLLLVATSRRGFDFLAREENTLPPPAEIPPGPIGRDTLTDMNVDLVAYARYGRVLAGVSLAHFGIAEDVAATGRLHGRTVSLRDLFYGSTQPASPETAEWVRTLEGYFRELR